MKTLWELRYALGTLLAFGVSLSLAGWTVAHFPLYVGVGIGLIAVFIIASQPRIRRERKRIDAQVEAAFREAYAELTSPPSITQSSSYGYPTFEIKFRTRPERDAAAPRNESFTRAIGKIFQGYGPSSRPFRAELAIFFTYENELDELRAQYEVLDPVTQKFRAPPGPPV